MNRPSIYICPLPRKPPSPDHPSRLSQSRGFGFPVHLFMTFILFIVWPHLEAYEIFLPPPGIELGALAMTAQSFNHCGIPYVTSFQLNLLG